MRDVLVPQLEFPRTRRLIRARGWPQRDWGRHSASAALNVVLSILATIAKQERIRLSERTMVGLERARKQGRVGGRPRVVTDRAKIREMRAAGATFQAIADEMQLPVTTVCQICKEAA